MEKIKEPIKEKPKVDKKKPYAKYTTDTKKTDHFTIQAEKYVNQINRALYRLELISTGRTYIYMFDRYDINGIEIHSNTNRYALIALLVKKI